MSVFAAEPEVETGQIVELMEITMRNLLAGGQIDLSDFLARADVLAAAGKTVLQGRVLGNAQGGETHGPVPQKVDRRHQPSTRVDGGKGETVR